MKDKRPWVQVVYTGRIYEGKQDPCKLFQAVSELIAEGVFLPEEISVEIYGEKQGWVEGKIKQYELGGIVKQYGGIPTEEAREKQRQAHILWIMRWEGREVRYGFIFKALCWLSLDRKMFAYAGEFNRKFGGKAELGVVPGKIYEYMAAGRPVLATGGQRDELTRIIEETKIGVCCDTVEEIKCSLVEL